jgi:23S rRNA 5-hydroxycytidine C2501 synthase
MDSIELMAPAKDPETGMAAIDCGADAVYIGAGRFSAREAAGNPASGIEKLAGYAHKYWARVYVALNTLLRDDEIPEALRLIREFDAIPVDGLIIQDAGLLECGLPPLPLIASTQMHNNSPEKVEFLEKVGFRRAILARELSLGEIEAIRKRTKLELECFVHGALCVSYSGRCAMSYAIGGRSGNRGQCAQPCRRKYSLEDASGNVLVANKHLLSLKDLDRSASLLELVRAGVTSFKIEGRLKDRAYVMNVTSYYRKKLDAVLEETGMKRSSSGKSIPDFGPDPAKTFNRGKSEHFLHGRKDSMAALDTPKSTGQQIGAVVSVEKDGFRMDSRIELHPGDGICFFDQTGELAGTNVNRVRAGIVTPRKMAGIRKGAMIFRNEDKEFLQILNSSRTARKIGVSMEFSETEMGFSLKLSDEDGLSVETAWHGAKKPAEKDEAAEGTVRKQLARLGGTEFEPAGLDIRWDRPCFIPVSELNALRRAAVEKLARAREVNRPKASGGAAVNEFPYPENQLTYMGNVLNSKAEAFYRRHGVAEIERSAESGLDMRGRKVMTTKYCLLFETGRCLKNKSGPAEKSRFFLKDEDGRRFELVADCEKCEMEIFFRG